MDYPDIPSHELRRIWYWTYLREDIVANIQFLCILLLEHNGARTFPRS